MGKITGFLEFERSDRDYEPIEERIQHWREFVLPLPDAENTKQAARCMDCGIPLLPHRLSGEQPDPGLIAARTFASCSPIPFQRRVVRSACSPRKKTREPVSPSSAQHRLEACAASSSTARR
jgi:hypothetical protein